jgi:Mn2+/Fe2+ NRAMP family transporter
VLLTRRSDIMGSLANRGVTTAATACIAGLIIGLNGYLLYAALG